MSDGIRDSRGLGKGANMRPWVPETQEKLNKFVWVDYDMGGRAVASVFDRGTLGCAVRTLVVHQFVVADIHDLSLQIASLCARYNCPPLINVNTVAGARLLNLILQQFGK